MRLFKNKPEEATEESPLTGADDSAALSAPNPRPGDSGGMADTGPPVDGSGAGSGDGESDEDAGPQLAELAPSDVDLPLAFKLAAIDQAELNLAKRAPLAA